MAELTAEAILLKHFAPGEGQEANSRFMSTSDVFAVIDEHAPGRYTQIEVYEALQKNDFRNKLMETSINWILVPR